jgi:sulfonate transport system permease protein
MPDGLRRYATPLVLLVVWQLGSSLGLISSQTIASPTEDALAFWQLAASGELWYHLLASLRRVGEGLGFALVFGVGLALFAGLSRRGEHLIDALMQMLRTLPFLGLVPLLILWFGIGEAPKVLLVALGATFPIYLSLFSGIRGVDVKLLEAARVFGVRGHGLIRHVVLPGALPSAFIGLRYGLGVAWLSLVVAEQVNASSGIGYLINQARDFMRTDIILVGLIIYSLLGLATDALVRAAERTMLAWRPSMLSAAAR